MPDLRHDLERMSERFELTPGALDRLFKRHQHKQRNRRIRASALGLVVAVAATGGLVNSFRHVGSETPATPSRGMIVFTRQDPESDVDYVYVIDARGSGAREPLRIGTGDFLSVSPDGTRILFAFFDTTGTASQWVKPGVVNLDGSDWTVLPIADAGMSGLVPSGWSPDGTRFVAQGIHESDPMAEGIYTARSSDGGDLAQVTVTPTGGVDRPVGGYSPDGSKILFIRPVKAVARQDASQDLLVVNTDGTGVVRVNPPGTTTGWDEASWSPDGSQVAFVGSRGSFLGAPRAVFVVDADGANPRRITTWGDIDGAEWSPDGGWIAFSRAHPDDRDLFLVRPDGTGLTQITTGADGLSSSGPVWSPDGTRVLFARSSTGFTRTTTGGPFDSDLWIVSADGTGLEQVTHRPAEYYRYEWGTPG